MSYARYPSLLDRVVFITGGGSGIGAAMVEAFVAQKANVAFVDIETEPSKALAAKLGASGPAPLFIKCDLVDVAALEAAMEEVHQRLGPIGVLVNNAANDQREDAEEVSEEDWDQAMAINLKHQFFAARQRSRALVLFAVQPFGTAAIGRAFGPIMLAWFLIIAALGVYGIMQHPAVFVAINPLYGLDYLMRGGAQSFLVLGGVFLCVTGAEALYADMGQFGPGPIRLAWNLVVFPALILNYAGQAAIVLAGAPTEGNIFYRLCPAPLLTPLIVLATIATVIASQSIITGAYSMTRQAIQLGWLPRMTIKQTSEEGYGQIYVGTVNWLLMIVTLGLTIGFGKSDNLAAAYGIAVSATMLMTSVLLFIAMREVWNWPIWAAVAVAALFIVIDASFLAANMAKVFQGGWVPLLLACIVYGVMWIWHRGAQAVQKRVESELTPLSTLIDELNSGKIRHSCQCFFWSGWRPVPRKRGGLNVSPINSLRGISA